jgi:hypothetical protein
VRRAGRDNFGKESRPQGGGIGCAKARTSSGEGRGTLWTTTGAWDGANSAGHCAGAAELRWTQINYGRAELWQPEHESEFLTSRRRWGLARLLVPWTAGTASADHLRALAAKLERYRGWAWAKRGMGERAGAGGAQKGAEASGQATWPDFSACVRARVSGGCGQDGADRASPRRKGTTCGVNVQRRWRGGPAV